MFRRCRDDEQRLSGVAMAEHTIGHVRESQRALDELIATQASCCAYQVAEVYAWRGEREQAFEWLDRAYRQFDGALSDMRVDPLLSSLHDDPRYKALLRKMNLPD
jgi:serine/threonine-protein kinase